MTDLKDSTGGKMIEELYQEMRDVERLDYRDFKFSVTMPHDNVALANTLSVFFGKTRTFLVAEIMDRVLMEMLFSMDEKDRIEVLNSAHEESIKLAGGKPTDYTKWHSYIEHYKQEAEKNANS